MAKKNQFCSLCERNSSIPIRECPSREDLSTIIDCAKTRVRNNKIKKYSGCVRISKCSVDDLVNISYHRSCFKDFTRKDSLNTSISESTLTVEEYVSRYIERNVTSHNPSFDTNTVSSNYMKSVTNMSEKAVKKRIKAYVETRIDVLIMRPPVRNQPELIVSKDHVQHIFFNHNESASNKDDKLLEAIQIIRNNILARNAWHFEGSFENFEVDKNLLQLFKTLIGGSKAHAAKSDIISKAAFLLLQIAEQMMLTDRQAKYSAPVVRTQRETPLSVGLALDLHKTYRSRKLLNEVNELGMGISYFKVLEIENDLAISVQKMVDKTGGYAAPKWLRSNEFMCFAIDNIDFNEATYSGKNSLHGTVLCVFQDKPNIEDCGSIHFTRTKLKTSNRLPCTLEKCIEPLPQATVYSIDISSLKSNNYSEKQDETRLWITSFLNNDPEANSKVLTWSGFNSRLVEKFNPVKNIGLIAPLLRTPPTQYETLLADIFRAGKINVQYNGTDVITVVGLDMQLYDLAMRLWTTNENIRRKYFFVAGQLHTVFWALQNIGSYIKGSMETRDYF